MPSPPVLFATDQSQTLMQFCVSFPSAILFELQHLMQLECAGGGQGLGQERRGE